MHLPLCHVVHMLAGQGYGLTNIPQSVTPWAMEFNGYYRRNKQIPIRNFPIRSDPLSCLSFCDSRLSLMAKMALNNQWPWKDKKGPLMTHHEIKGKPDQLPWFSAKISTTIGTDSAQRLWLSLEISSVPTLWALQLYFWIIGCACVCKMKTCKWNSSLGKHGATVVGYHLRERHFLLPPPPTLYTLRHMLRGVIAGPALGLEVLLIISLNKTWLDFYLQACEW